MHRVLALAILALVALGACAPNSTATPPGSAGASQPAATGTSTGPATPGTTGATLPGQSDTSWGRIWEALPPSFPAIPGAQAAEVVSEPVSGAFDLPAAAGSAADVARTFADALGAAGWTVTVDGPLEDGSFVVDGGRPGTLCVTRVLATPLGGTVRLIALYGADCPFA